MAFSNTILPNVAPVEAGGPALSALKNVYGAQKQNLENQFYLPIQRANALSKLAYAQFAGPNAVAKFLNDPAVANSLTRDEYNNLKDYFQNSVNTGAGNPLAGFGGAFGGPFSGSAGGNSGFNPGGSMVGNLLNSLLSKIGVGGGQQGAAMPAQSNTSSANNLLNAPQTGDQNERATPADVSNVAMNGNGSSVPNTFINRTAPDYRGNSMGGLNPATVGTAQAEALKTQATGEAANINQLWKHKFDEDDQITKTVPNNLAIVDKLRNAYSHLSTWEKGPGFGNLQAFSTAASDVDKGQAALADSVARAQQSGHITQTDRATYQSMKPTRDQPGEGFPHQLDFVEAMNRRQSELPAFHQRANEMNLTPNQTDSIWQLYAKERPFYDGKNNRINNGENGAKDNLGTWEDYLTPQKMKQAFSPRAQKSSTNRVTKSWIIKDGKLVPA